MQAWRDRVSEAVRESATSTVGWGGGEFTEIRAYLPQFTLGGVIIFMIPPRLCSDIIPPEEGQTSSLCSLSRQDALNPFFNISAPIGLSVLHPLLPRHLRNFPAAAAAGVRLLQPSLSAATRRHSSSSGITSPKTAPTAAAPAPGCNMSKLTIDQISSPVPRDIEISQSLEGSLSHIAKVGEDCGILESELEPYGRFKAKVGESITNFLS